MTARFEAQIVESHEGRATLESRYTLWDRMACTLYGVALAASISFWFLAFRAPLDTDETGSYWQISSGLSKIWPRQFLLPSSLPYAYILWFWTKIFGASEIALRMLSVLAMLGAVYLLYRAAREIFGHETALLATVLFCVHYDILFASIDVRPYAFAVLSINLVILILIRLRYSNSNWLAALFGLSAAFIVGFQFLFAVILPALVVCFFVLKVGDRRKAWRQFGVALAVFTLAILPILPEPLFLFRTRETHVCDTAPNVGALIATFVPGWLLPIFVCLALVAFLVSKFSTPRRDSHVRDDGWKILLCLSLAIIPVLILYSVSVGTPIHVFTERYRMVSIPGIALCWAFVLSRFRPRALRLLFCICLVSLSGISYLHSPVSTRHEASWKHALEVVETNASADNAPVLICGAFIESDFAVMPIESAKTSPLFAPLSYYRIDVPVIPLPRDLNSETRRVGSIFLQQEAYKHQRFFVVEPFGSHKTIEWIEQGASAAYTFKKLEDSDGFEIVEFVPRAAAHDRRTPEP